MQSLGFVAAVSNDRLVCDTLDAVTCLMAVGHIGAAAGGAVHAKRVDAVECLVVAGDGDALARNSVHAVGGPMPVAAALLLSAQSTTVVGLIAAKSAHVHERAIPST